MGIRTLGAGAGVERSNNSAGRSWNLEKDIRNSERGKECVGEESENQAATEAERIWGWAG